MTDKQIITKDVDTRGCKFFRHGVCASPINPKCELCVEISEKMCYYKQLKRKEQECERLKRDYFKQNEWLQEQKKELDQLKSENEELKKQYKELGQCSKNLKDYFEKEKETLSNRFLKLKQTLTEIKEIAETAAKCMYATYSDDYTEGYSWLGSIILQKISEVEDETINN